MQSPTNNSDLAVPPGDLQFIQQVGAGGYGEVWKGKWRGKGGGIIVAIKKVPVTKLNPRQQREILVDFKHPNILTIFGVCFFEERELWIVMEYMEGGSLFDLLHSDLSIGWDARLRLAQQAAIGLHVLHSSRPSVIHRDLKSFNYMVSMDGNTVKLTEFGMSKVNSVSSSTFSAVSRESIGTIRWGAPETFDYPPLWTEKADIYSLGMTFWEIASRKLPFGELPNDTRVIHVVQTLKVRPEISSDCPKEFADIIRECWRDDAGQRPSSVQLLEMLEAAVESFPSSISAPVSATSLSNYSSNHSPSTRTTSASTNSSTTTASAHPISPPTTISFPSIDPAASQSRRFAVAEVVTTFAGHTSESAEKEGAKDGTGTKASFIRPSAMCFNPCDGCTYVCDEEDHSIRRVTMQGDVTTFMRQNLLERALLASGKKLNKPLGIVMNNKENIFLVATSGNHTICKITPSGTVSVFAGSGQEGSHDGIGTKASFNSPGNLAINQETGSLFVSDVNNHTVRKVTPQGEVTTLAGSERGYTDGKGAASKFNTPRGIWYDNTSQSLIVCDWGNNKLRRVQLNGDVTTLCEVPEPMGIVMTANRIILVSSSLHYIFKVTQKGQESYKVTILAGCGEEGRRDGRASTCSFNKPRGIVVDESTHSCYVADWGNHVIRKISFDSD